MTTLELLTSIASFVGAAAWLPQIFTWIYLISTKPLIRITPDKFIEIGYTAYGPILNVRLSINVEKKDALLNNICLILRHEDGAEYQFEWVGMTEVLSEIKNNRGENQIVQQNSVPIQIKLSTLYLCEKFFNFHESKFLIDKHPELDKLSAHWQYLKKYDEACYDKFFMSNEFENYLKFMREKFLWKAGNYQLTFNVCPLSEAKLIPIVFNFQLTQDNIEFLRKNLDEIKIDAEYGLRIKNNRLDISEKRADWRWRNVLLTPSLVP